MEYLIYQNEEQKGPFGLDDIQQMLCDGQITKDTLGWQDGMSDWSPIGEIVQIEEHVVSRSVSRGARVEKTVDAAFARFVTEEQDPAAVQKVINRIKDILTKGEEIEYVGVQKKPVITISPDSVVLTNKRFIIARPKLTGFKFEDFQWREVYDVHLSEQMMSATISCTIVGGQKTSIDSIPKKQARRIYSYAQEVEEKMIEERRNREMEERRAAAGGVVIQSPTQTSTETSDDPLAQLGKLKKMLEADLIEQSEFDTKKAEILARL